jgi:hypothetical protein
MVEIGYNGDPISGYSPEQMAIHNQTTGAVEPDRIYRFDDALGRMVSEPNPRAGMPREIPISTGSYGDTPEDFGYGQNPFRTFPIEPQRPMPPMYPEPFPGFPIEPQRPTYPDYRDVEPSVYTPLPDGSQVQMPNAVTPPFPGYPEKPDYPSAPYNPTSFVPEEPTPTNPFPGYPIEPTRPDPVYRPSYGEINSYVQQYMNDPRAIADAIGKYNVSASDLAGATGYNSDQINQYFQNAGIDPFRPTQDPSINPVIPKEPERPQRDPVPGLLPSDMDFMRRNSII